MSSDAAKAAAAAAGMPKQVQSAELLTGSENKEKEKYTKGDAFDALLTVAFINSVELCSTDTINETVLQDVIKKSGKTEEFLTVAVQLALAGFGGRDYGQYSFKGETKELKQFFNAQHVRFNNKLQDKLKPDELTPRRLIRVFRSTIVKFLLKRTDTDSYLYKKYAAEHNVNYRQICFPGAEHFITTKNEADFLISAYKKLDKAMHDAGKPTDITTRIKRVLFTRGVQFNSH